MKITMPIKIYYGNIQYITQTYETINKLEDVDDDDGFEELLNTLQIDPLKLHGKIKNTIISIIHQKIDTMSALYKDIQIHFDTDKMEIIFKSNDSELESFIDREHTDGHLSVDYSDDDFSFCYSCDWRVES